MAELYELFNILADKIRIFIFNGIELAFQGKDVEISTTVWFVLALFPAQDAFCLPRFIAVPKDHLSAAFFTRKKFHSPITSVLLYVRSWLGIFEPENLKAKLHNAERHKPVAVQGHQRFF
jgi:hypothetical protein